MKTTVSQIFNYIQGLNPSTSTVSSIGTFVSESARQTAEFVLSEIITELPEGTLAHKIATTADRFSPKQLWVIAFELEKNVEFAKKVTSYYAQIESQAKAKTEASKAKKAANKAASADVLSEIKSAGKKLGDYYKWLNTSNNPFRKEFFSKKYSRESVAAFLKVN